MYEEKINQDNNKQENLPYEFSSFTKDVVEKFTKDIKKAFEDNSSLED